MPFSLPPKHVVLSCIRRWFLTNNGWELLGRAKLPHTLISQALIPSLGAWSFPWASWILVRVLQVPSRCFSSLPKALPTGPETRTIHCHSFLQDLSKGFPSTGQWRSVSSGGLHGPPGCAHLHLASFVTPKLLAFLISLDLTRRFLVYFFCCFLPLLCCFLFCPPFLSVSLCLLILKPFLGHS